MDRLIVFGGTTEGRELCQKCLEQLNNVVIHVFVATEQGKEVLPKDGKLVVHTGRLTSMEMADIIGTLCRCHSPLCNRGYRKYCKGLCFV